MKADINAKLIAERIKERRSELNLSYQDLADKTGLSKSTLQRYETGDIANIPLSRVSALAAGLNVSPEHLMGLESKPKRKKKRIPIYGEIAAGVAIEAIEDILGYVEVDEDEYSDGDYLALQIQGHSMEPRMRTGDVVIIRRQPCIENGQIAAVMINGDSATVKKVVMHDSGISLVSTNPVYEPMFFSRKEINELPVTIIGKVVELRAKF